MTVDSDPHPFREATMTDIVERLRQLQKPTTRPPHIGAYWDAIEEAADEIERLRAQVGELQARWNEGGEE